MQTPDRNPHLETPDRNPHLELMDEIRHYLQNWFPDFAYSKRDDYLFAALYVEFRGVDILDELKAFHAWCLDRDTDGISYRLSFRRWLAKGATFRAKKPK